MTLKGYGFRKTDKIVILHTHLVAATTVCLSSVVMLLSAPQFGLAVGPELVNFNIAGWAGQPAGPPTSASGGETGKHFLQLSIREGSVERPRPLILATELTATAHHSLMKLTSTFTLTGCHVLFLKI